MTIIMYDQLVRHVRR